MSDRISSETKPAFTPERPAMRDEYDFSNARKNPYAAQLKKSVTIRLDEDSIAYFKANSSVSDTDIAREVDRYFNWPGQATSYMVGQLKIAELRKRAETELGPRFDIRDFHEAVLSEGALPLDILEEQVERYIAAHKQ